MKLENIKICNLTLKVFKKLNDNNINYCHFKSNSHLDDAIYGNTDFDIIVDKKDFTKFTNIISDFGFKEVISQPGSKYDGIYDFIGLDKEKGKIIHLHTHTQILTGTKFVKEYKIFFDNLFLREKYQTQLFDIKIPLLELELILLIFRLGLKTSYFQILKNKIPDNILEEINFLVKNGINIKKINEILNENYFTEKEKIKINKLIKLFIENKNIGRKELLNIKNTINSIINPYKITNFVYLKKIFHKYYEIFRAIKFRIFKKYTHYKKNIKNGGIVISFIGPDGSGKSTIIKTIKKDFLYKLNTQNFYLGTGDGEKIISLRLFQLLLKIFRIGVNNNSNNKKNENNNIIKSKGFIYDSIAGFYYFLISLDKKSKIKNIIKHKAHGVLCLTDRFPQTTICGINDGISCYNKNNITPNGFIAKYFFKKEKKNYDFIMSNLPDLVIKLTLPAEIAYNRKKDYDKQHNLNNIKNKIDIIKNLNFDTKIIEIDVNKNLDKVILEIKNEIWKMI